MIRRLVLLIGLILLPLTAIAGQTILVFGDSLSAAYGIPRDAGWVSLLEKKLADENPGWRVVNASVSGETTSGGLSRILPALLAHKPSIVILELGANDGLRGLAVEDAQRNLNKIMDACRKTKAKVLLVGMRIPPNYGLKYASDFRMMYVDLANRNKAILVPFLLDGVAGKPELIQPDGLHPIAKAQPRVLQNVWPGLQKLLTR
jgi:acyl-CoA thioesterase-1